VGREQDAAHQLQPAAKAAIVTRSSAARWLRTLIITMPDYPGLA
jgi:hypothetical protein